MAALLVAYILPVCALLAPCHPGAALRDLCNESLLRDTRCSGRFPEVERTTTTARTNSSTRTTLDSEAELLLDVPLVQDGRRLRRSSRLGHAIELDDRPAAEADLLQRCHAPLHVHAAAAELHPLVAGRVDVKGCVTALKEIGF